MRRWWVNAHHHSYCDTDTESDATVPTEDSPWYTQLLVSLAVLLGVALLIAGVVTAAGIKAADIAGISAPRPSSPESLVVPSPTTTASSPEGGQPSRTNPSQSPTQTHRTRSPANRPITLTAKPRQVSAGERINLTGSYAGADGTTLQVQRQESPGVWSDFPVTTSVSGGSYATYILTSQTGTNKLRMLDKRTGETSNVVKVNVS